MSASEIDERLFGAGGRDGPGSELLREAFATGRLPERAAVLASILFDPEDGRAALAAAILSEHLRGAEAAALRALERDYRSPRFIRRWRGVELDAARWATRVDLEHEPRLAALAIGSVQRDGWIREEATRELANRDEVVAAGLLFLRLNDPVTQIAAVAIDGLERWRVPSRASSVVRYLPLLDALQQWVRASQTGVAGSWYALFDRDEAVLFAHARSGDPASRGSAIRRLAALRAGRPSIEEVLELALSDPAPRLRRWAAVTAANGALTPPAVRDRLVHRMWSDTSPRIREIALRYLRRLEGGDRYVESALFDANAGVRFYARRFAKRGGLALPYRDLAVAVLLEPTADRRAIVGALALLSDNGTREDASTVRLFLDHSHRAVRAEARRTLHLLEG